MNLIETHTSELVAERRDAMRLACELSLGGTPHAVIADPGGLWVVVDRDQCSPPGNRLVATFVDGEVQMPNARFWVRACGGWAKLTLKPRQMLRHFTRGRDSEGCWFNTTTWTHRGGEVERVIVGGGKDCDGRHSWSGICRLRLPDMAEATVGSQVPVPTWEELTTEEQDFTAEAAGY